jgi:hypothetical protein
MKRFIPLLMTGFLCLSPVSAGEALWNPCTTAQLREASDLIVIGRILDIEAGPSGPRAIDRAHLRVERVLHGRASSIEVPLVFPGRQRGILRSDGSLEPEVNSAFIRFDLEQEGIFFLRSRGDGTYSANHPARFKPRFLLGQVLRDLTGTTPGG